MVDDVSPGRETARDVAVLADGSIAIAGGRGGAGPLQADLERFDLSGNPIGEPFLYDGGGVGALAWGVAAFGDGAVIGGTLDDGRGFAMAVSDNLPVWTFIAEGEVFDVVTDGKETWLAGSAADGTTEVWRIAADGSALDATALNTNLGTELGSFYGAARGSGVLLLAGARGENQSVSWVVLAAVGSGALLWSWSIDEFASTSGAAYGGTFSPGGALLAVGDYRVQNSAPKGWIKRRDTGGTELPALSQCAELGGNYHAIATTPDSGFVVAGWTLTGVGKRIAVVKYAADGSVVWIADDSGDAPFDAENTGWSIAVAPDGLVIAVGEVIVGESSSPPNIARWIAAYEP